MATQPSPILDAMRELQGALHHFDRETARTLGLGLSDAGALRFLVEHGPATPGAIQRELGLTSGSVTALLDRLEKAGLAQRGPHPNDRRALIVAASKAGISAHTAALTPLHQFTTRLAARLQPERSEAVTRQLGDLTRLVEWAAKSGA